MYPIFFANRLLLSISPQRILYFHLTTSPRQRRSITATVDYNGIDKIEVALARISNGASGAAGQAGAGYATGRAGAGGACRWQARITEGEAAHWQERGLAK